MLPKLLSQTRRAACNEKQDKVEELAKSKESLQHEVDTLKDSAEQLSINQEQLLANLQAEQATLQVSEAAKIDAEVCLLSEALRPPNIRHVYLKDLQ